MKVLVNGGLNVSELDGWWAEAYAPEVGWPLGDGREHDDSWDGVEAEALYTLLEQQVIPEFYERDEQGMPRKWLARIRESMARLTPEFSANRAVREYTEGHYLPAAAAYHLRAADGGKVGAELLAWRDQIDRHWGEVQFGPMDATRKDDLIHFDVAVRLGGLNPDAIRVELFAEGQNGGEPVLQVMQRGQAADGGGYHYTVTVPDGRSENDFTPRVVPFHEHASVPLEAREILWRR